MKKLFKQIVTLGLLLAINISCEQTAEPDTENPPTTDSTLNKEYPTKLYKLDSVELSRLKTESVYPLDSFGLFVWTGILSSGYSSIEDTNSLVSLAKHTLVTNSKFSNVFSDSSLVLKSVKRSSLVNYTYWDIIFRNQIYKGLEVLNTEIIMRANDTITCIRGHFFKDIFIPKEGLLPIDTIRDKIVGKTIEYYDFSGLRTKVITDQSIVDDFIKTIYWINKGAYIEFRVAWQVPILRDEDSNDTDIGWYLYVDVLSGEILGSVATFIA